MPLKVNGVLIENMFAPVGVENYDNLEKADDGDTRKRAFCNHEYIKGFQPFASDIYNGVYFKVNGEATSFARKGCRPRFNLRATITEIGVDYYVIKSDDGAIWLSKAPTITAPDAEAVEIIPASVDCQDPLCEIIGAGGGGSGGGTALNGVGGGAGAYFLGCLRGVGGGVSEEYYLFRFRITSGGGTGSSNRGKAGDGGDVEIGYDGRSTVYTIGGGKGADGGTAGAGGTITSFLADVPQSLYAEAGSNGYAGLSGDHTFEQITVRCGYEGETQCEKVYGPYSVESNEAGAGGNSFFGAGGAPGNSYGDDGESPEATAYGAGGGGGRMKPFGSTTGGNGGGAVINIYY